MAVKKKKIILPVEADIPVEITKVLPHILIFSRVSVSIIYSFRAKPSNGLR